MVLKNRFALSAAKLRPTKNNYSQVFIACVCIADQDRSQKVLQHIRSTKALNAQYAKMVINKADTIRNMKG